MKFAIFPAALAAAVLSVIPPAHAQDANEAALARQADEERYRTLSARIANLEESNQSLQKKVQDLTELVQSLRDELGRAANNKEVAATQERLNSLQKAVEEVDRKRMTFQETVLKNLEELRKAVTDRPAPQVRPSGAGGSPGPSSPGGRTPATSPGGRSGTEEGYNYTVKKGDTLSGLVSKLRSQGLNVTQKQIMEANPGVNWNRVREGTTIFIPKPAN